MNLIAFVIGYFIGAGFILLILEYLIFPILEKNQRIKDIREFNEYKNIAKIIGNPNLNNKFPIRS
ncbi:MAG: hypothetical protein ABGF52_13515 [Candidatus Asgardarchaeum sp.]